MCSVCGSKWTGWSWSNGGHQLWKGELNEAMVMELTPLLSCRSLVCTLTRHRYGNMKDTHSIQLIVVMYRCSVPFHTPDPQLETSDGKTHSKSPYHSRMMYDVLTLHSSLPDESFQCLGSCSAQRTPQDAPRRCRVTSLSPSTCVPKGSVRTVST